MQQDKSQLITEQNLLQTIYAFLNSELTIIDFEQWIYTTDQLEQSLGADHYLDLISFDFHSKGSEYALRRWLKQVINVDSYEKWRISRLLTNLFSEDVDPVVTVSYFYDLYCSGYSFLRWIGLPYVLGIDEVPTLSEKHLWEASAFAQARQRLTQDLAKIRPVARLILNALQNGDITIVEEGSYQITPELHKILVEGLGI